MFLNYDALTNALVTILVTISPHSLAPLFLVLTRGMDRKQRNQVAIRSSVIATLTLLIVSLRSMTIDHTIVHAGSVPAFPRTMTSEAGARKQIDRKLEQTGWVVRDLQYQPGTTRGAWCVNTREPFQFANWV